MKIKRLLFTFSFLLLTCPSWAACAVVVQNVSATDATHYTTASGTWTTGALQLMTFVNTKASAVDDIDHITTTGLTWHKLRTIANAGATQRLSVWYSMGTGSSGTTDVDFNGATQTNGIWIWEECTGVRTDGTDGINAWKNDGQLDQTSATTTPSMSLPNPVATGNASHGSITVMSNNGIAPGGSYTELGERGSGTAPNCRAETEYLAAGSQTVNWTTASEASMMIGFEIVKPLVGGLVVLGINQ